MNLADITVELRVIRNMVLEQRVQAEKMGNRLGRVLRSFAPGTLSEDLVEMDSEIRNILKPIDERLDPVMENMIGLSPSGEWQMSNFFPMASEYDKLSGMVSAFGLVISGWFEMAGDLAKAERIRKEHEKLTQKQARYPPAPEVA